MIASGDLDQVGNQVVAALQLHVDLREGVLERVARGHQAVVDAHAPECDGGHNHQQYQQRKHQSSPHSCNRGNRR
jgi:hypothetical protein